MIYGDGAERVEPWLGKPDSNATTPPPLLTGFHNADLL